MGDLNTDQKELCDNLEGFIVVDAGPGTGKTHTIVSRYINTLNTNVDPLNILMLTFTRNAATEMEERISAEISKITSVKGYKGPLENAEKNLRVSTMDSFCLDVVLNSPEVVKEFFDPNDDDLMLSRSATLVENETLNKQYFAEFYADFINDHREEYIFSDCDIAATVGEKPMDFYEILCKLMARGILPMKRGWFGNGERLLYGETDELKDSMVNRRSIIKSKINEGIRKGEYPSPESYGNEITDEIIDTAINDDRTGLFELIHDVYYNYIIRCIKNNRLTFGLCELFALIILMKSSTSREMHSVDYLTIDEFQDTNELQMKICLLLLNKPNMCAVGDWKQGIFGFRYVSTANITEFKKRIGKFINEMEKEEIKFPFETWNTREIDFICNYRSSEDILGYSFKSLDIKATEEDVIRNGKIVELTPVKKEDLKGKDDFKWIEADDAEDEIRKAVDLITEYRFKGDYKVIDVEEKEGKKIVSSRDIEFGDIAVLCRTGKNCVKVFDECKRRGIPVYLQGDIEIMNTTEGKLALAWLRLVNNPKDERALATILTFMNYPLSEIEKMRDAKWENIPEEIVKNLGKLNQKKRRLNNLVTYIFHICGMNNEVVQTIINVLSSAHGDSLMTISDLIRLIEDDIENGTKYNVEPKLDKKAVIVQTIHKSKGLEYPAVIIVGLNQKSFPNLQGDDEILIYNDTLGLRCTKEYISDYDSEGKKREMIITSWKTKAVKYGTPPDYSEERRLLFVAMTRAKQFLAITAWNPSKFFNYFKEKYMDKGAVPKRFDVHAELYKTTSDRPVIGKYRRRRDSISVHDLMDTIDISEGTENRHGKGKEYGEEVHKMAYLYLRRQDKYIEHQKEIEKEYPEMVLIRNIIDQRRDSKLSGEIKCVLPVDDVSIKGTIDLIAEYEDRIEIHDYKTDPDERYSPRYRFQLGLYALSAEPIGKKIECYIHYVCLDKKTRVEPITMEDVRERIAEYRRRLTETPE